MRQSLSSDPHMPIPHVRTRSWEGQGSDRSWQYRVGFDHENRPVRLEILGLTDERRALALAWRTASGEWVGRYRCATGYALAHLSPVELELVEVAAKMALLNE